MEPHDAILESAVEALVERDAEITRLRAKLIGANAGVEIARTTIGLMVAESASRLTEQKRRIVVAIARLDRYVQGQMVYVDHVFAAIDKACEVRDGD